MNIIKLAREARLAEPSHPFNPWGASIEALERFAALVAAAEREACATVCDHEFSQWIDKTDDGAVAVKNCATAIRARKDQT